MIVEIDGFTVVIELEIYSEIGIGGWRDQYTI